MPPLSQIEANTHCLSLVCTAKNGVGSSTLGLFLDERL